MSLIGERIKELRKQGKLNKEIMFELKVSEAKYYKILKQEGLSTCSSPKQIYLEANKDKIIEMYNSGMQAKDIGAFFNVSQTPFLKWAGKNGLKFKRGGKRR